MSKAYAPQEQQRIAKYLARAGVASRRGVEAMIAEGRVAVNGQVLDTPAFLVNGKEKILVDGKPIRTPDESRLFIYHKPAGLVTTHHDEQGRGTVFEAIQAAHPKLPRLISVGRLDLNTEGLLLLTNDGGLARQMELPSNGLVRTYRVRAFGHWQESYIKKLAEGMTVEGVRYGAITAEMEGTSGEGRNIRLRLSLAEGKNREIRKVLAALNLQVNKLLRISYGPYDLGDLKKGEVREVDPVALP